MKRLLLWSLLGLVVLVVALVSLVTVRAGEVEPLPPPDPALLIQLGDGSRLPLADVIERVRRGEPLPMLPPEAVEPITAELLASPVWRQTHVVVNGELYIDPDPLFALADQARFMGRYEEAMALYLSIPRDSDRYARARRLVAWNILARDLDQPEQAVQYANQALHADPFDGNVWQDWSRVCARTLGLPVD